MIPGILSGGMRMPVGAADPYWSNVELLLHFDGTNGSNLFVDSSSKSRSMSGTGVSISNSSSVYGGASGFFSDASSSSINPVGANSDLGFGAGDFTIELYLYFTGTVGGFKGLVSWGESVGQFYWQISNTQFFATGTGFIDHGLILNEWSHLAITRQSGQMRLFVRGTQVGSTWTSTTNYVGAADRPRIGNHPGGTIAGLNSYIDELRITKGIARYTANFTPPTEPFPNR